MRFITDAKVEAEIIQLIDDAKKELVLVSPYFNPWKHLERSLRSAVARGVRIFIVVREDPGKRNSQEQLKNAENMGISGIHIISIQWLHSKVYFNEASAIVTSMNLLESSSKNSLETAFTVDRVSDSSFYAEIAKYLKSLLNNVRETHVLTQHPEPSGAFITSSSQRRPSNSTTAARSKVEKPRARASSRLGACIRCSESIPKNINKPLCGSCYAIWSRYGDPSYVENFCHGCSEEMDSSMEKPFCRKCYAAER